MIKAGIQKGGAGRDHSPVVSMPSSGAAGTKKIHVSLSCDVKAVAVLANKRMIVFHKECPQIGQIRKFIDTSVCMDWRCRNKGTAAWRPLYGEKLAKKQICPNLL